MALELGLTYVQYNDATKIVLRDVSSGWGVDQEVDDVEEAVITLTEYPSGTVYPLDVQAIFDAALNDPSNLVFEIGAENLGGSAGHQIKDTLYYVDYNVKGSLPVLFDIDMLQLLILVDGQAQMRVFSKLMDAPLEIDMLDQLVLYREQDWELVVEPIVWYAYYQGMQASIYESKKIQVDNILKALTSITKNM